MLSLRKANFVRPVYWDEPLPARGELPPDDLRRLHFERIRPRRRADPGLPAAPPAGTPAVGDSVAMPSPSSTAAAPGRAGSAAPPAGTAAVAATARLIISVHDEQGPVPRAFVQLVNLKTQAVIRVTADVKGQARFEVPPGEYRIETRRTDAARAEQRGQFPEIPRTRTLRLAEGSDLEVGVVLRRGGPRGR